MERRTKIHRRFVAKFHFGACPTPVTDKHLDEIELELNTKLPTAYRQFMTHHGTVYTPTILELIEAQGIDHPDVQDFLSPQDVINNTKGYWSAGMPNDVIGVASDCMGNMIGFRRETSQVDDGPVVFFDHDYLEVRELTSSFNEFLCWYLDHL